MNLQDLYNSATTHHQRGNLLEAARLCGQILAANAKSTEALALLATIRFQQGQKTEAAQLIAAALQLAPDSPEALAQQGIILAETGDFLAALSSFDKALALTPYAASLWHNRAGALKSLHRFDEAVASYRRALAIEPKLVEAQIGLGSALLVSNHVQEGLEVFTRHALQMAGAKPAEPGPPHRARHDAEQKAYLDEAGIKTAFHLAEGARLATPAINPANASDIGAQWQSNQPQVVVIDNFLTDEALEKLRRFCWGSTVWRRNFNEGYLGALLEYGFSCPLIGQVAEELREVFPAILGEHPLLYLWAFKYDSKLSGVKIHADSAAVNVNFWITPDDANLDPHGGGLTVWDVAAPPDWDFEQYNGNEKAIREFLARSGSRPMTVPYRANRAVIFDSDLFHETDKIRFQDGYRNRRINITLLYGWRGGKI